MKRPATAKKPVKLAKKYPAWVPCPMLCGNFMCSIHRKHANECPCPEIDDWKVSPYHEGGRPMKVAPC